jgi:hypothetical protein
MMKHLCSLYMQKLFLLTEALRAESGLRHGPDLLARRLVHVLGSRLLSEIWAGSNCRNRVSGVQCFSYAQLSLSRPNPSR